MLLHNYFRDWLKVIDLVELKKVVEKINYLYKVKPCVPAYKDIFKAFTLCTLHDCKIIMMGFDPYPQKDVATGVLFANKPNVKNLSPSLKVFKESIVSLSVDMPFNTFDVTMKHWCNQGILMINSALTCEMNNTGSHAMIWRPFMTKLLQNLSKIETGIIYVLFGTQAQTFEPYINTKFNDILKVKHPAFYARTNLPMPNDIFTQINTLLIGKYGQPIQWLIEN